MMLGIMTTMARAFGLWVLRAWCLAYGHDSLQAVCEHCKSPYRGCARCDSQSCPFCCADMQPCESPCGDCVCGMRHNDSPPDDQTTQDSSVDQGEDAR